MKLKAMLVDDEINIIRNLQKVISWEAMQLELVGMASNGAMALELAQEHNPDLILSDIRMPVMDGITMLQRLREQGFQGEVIMLTGFQEFDYARSAIKYGAKDYIVKPIDYEELQQVIERLAGELRSKFAGRERDSNRWKQLSGIAYEKVLLDALMNCPAGISRQLLDVGSIKWNNTRFILYVIDLDDYSQLTVQDERERRLVHFAVRNVLQEVLLDDCPDYSVLQTREGEWCLLAAEERSPGKPSGQLRHWAERMQQAVERYTRLSVSVGVYPASLSLEELSGAYRSAKQAMRLSLQAKHIEIIGERAEAVHSVSSFWTMADGLVAALLQGDQEKAHELLERLLRELAEPSSLQAEPMLHFLSIHLLREMRSVGILTAEQEQTLWLELNGSRHIKLLVQTIYRIASECANGSAGNSRKSIELLMACAKDYIHRNVTRDLGVEELACHLGISTSYFSQLFKQHFEETFVEYVTRQRIELAKTLLSSSGKSVTQIGKLVGYAERRYFTKVFHKHEGMSPSEYREYLSQPSSCPSDSSPLNSSR
ncbi:response regulator [Paenibacillus sp. NPDC056579]|uniref:response regulator n=1 Tax=Paenibacillus sp. NPDC056579 TaxID=3345871 RepID=UPI0036AF5523